MREWEGMSDDKSDKAPGCLFLQNVDFAISGELRRRSGMERAFTQSGVVISDFWSPATGRWSFFVTSTGSVVALRNQ